jgi:hypothetical protein
MNIVEVDDSWRLPIEVLPLNQAFPELDKLSKSGIAEFREFNERKVVLSRDHERLFGVFSKKAVVVPHEELVDILSESYHQLYKDSDGTMNVVPVKDGAAIRVEMDLPLERPLDIGNGDISNLKLYAYNAYDKSFGLKIRTGVMRLICMNGAIIGDQIGSLSANELMDGWSTKSLSAKIDRLIKNSYKVTDVWQSWLDVEVPYEAADKVFSKAFPKKFIEPILEPHLFPMDMYNLYNLMTRRATHDTRTDRSRIVFDTNISSIFYGNKLINAIRGTDRLSAADDASNILEYSALESDISDRVTVTDDITH